MAGLENLTGTGDDRGEIAKPPRRSASSPTLDGRRVLAELQKVLKNIDEHPSQLIFGH